jgi:hypothetical protein
MKNKLLIITAAFTLLSIPKSNFAQAPSLGRVATFALFTKAGAFGNTGTTNVTGDIGTNVGAFTGFPPGTLTGTIHVADSVTALAAINLDTAYNRLTVTTCDSTIGATIGNGQTLTAKVYCITTLATLNGNLILNGQGNPNALFIFKINGALSTSNSSTITVINSASLNNVYWQINGSFTLGDSSVFRGTLIANGAINLLPYSSILGRGLSVGGAISLHSNVNTVPIILLSFNAVRNNKNVILKWSTTSEINNNYFSIERGTDGINWQTISIVKGAGNSTSLKNYSITDQESNNEILYYRLKQTDFDGNFKYFNTLVVNGSSAESVDLDIYPNPASGIVKLFLKGDPNQIHSISIYNLLGEKIFNSETFQSEIDLSNKPNGIYFLQYNLNSKTIIKKLVLKN